MPEDIFKRSEKLQDTRDEILRLTVTEVVKISLLCCNCGRWNGWADWGHCKAFGSDPIPDLILDGDYDHRQRFPDDNGRTWIPTAEAPGLDPETLKQGGPS